MRKKRTAAVLLFCILLGLCGCGKNQKEEIGSCVYYLNMDGTRIVPESYELEAEEQMEQVGELIGKLQEQPEESGIVRTIPETVQLQGYQIEGLSLVIDFSDSYYKMSNTQEALVRAAIVRTMLQVRDVSYVSFTVNGQALMNFEGQLVGNMNADSFVDNPGEQINSSQETILTLYFANSSGNKLVKETRKVHYSSNISLEKLVIEQLIEGPKSSDMKATMPSDAKLITISVVDEVCYVNLDASAVSQNSDITEEVLLYSIVDSLAELEHVSKVQISVNGETKGKLRYVYDLSNMYEPDYKFVEGDSSVGETTEE